MAISSMFDSKSESAPKIAPTKLAKILLERLRGGVRGLQWLALLTGIVVFAVFNLLLTLFLPSGGRAEIYANLIAAIIAIAVAPYLLRTIDGMQQQVERQNKELRSLHAIDSALNRQRNLQAILEVGVSEATLAVDGEMGALWLFDAVNPSQIVDQAFYNVPPERQFMMTQHLMATTEADARRWGRPLRRQEIDDTWSSDRHARLLRLRSTLTVPILDQQTVLGLIMICNCGGASPIGGFADEDEALIVATASTLSVAIQNARLYDESQRRGEMLRTLVAHTAEAVAASSDAKRLMQILADAAAQIIDCPRVAIYAYPTESFSHQVQMALKPLAFHDASGDMDPGVRSQPLEISAPRLLLVASIEDSPGVAVRYVPSVAMTLGIPHLISDFLDAPGYLFVLRSRDRKSIGLLTLLDREPRPRTDDRDAFAQALAAQASIGLENALLGEKVQIQAERDKHVAEVFQTSMLPPVPDRIGAFEFAKKYQAALDESILGGDFYDLFAIGPDHWGIVMADVSGKGLKAAVQTAMVKYMLRGFAHENPNDPGCVLHLVNHVLSNATSGFEGFVTLFFGVLNTISGELVYANAGHEPPLFREAETESATSLDGESGLPLGCIAGSEYETHTRTFADRDLLLLFTDGLSEARSPESTFLGTDGVQSYVAATDLNAQAAIESIYASVRAYTGNNLRDDVAMLLIRRAD